MSPCTFDPGFYICPQGSAPGQRARKNRRDGQSCSRYTFRYHVLEIKRPTQRTIRNHRPGTDNSPRAQRGLRTFHRRSSPSRPCGACTIAIVRSPHQCEWIPDKSTTTYPVTHETLLVLCCARVPALKVVITALAPTQRCKVNKDGSDATLVRRVLAGELS